MTEEHVVEIPTVVMTNQILGGVRFGGGDASRYLVLAQGLIQCE